MSNRLLHGTGRALLSISSAVVTPPPPPPAPPPENIMSVAESQMLIPRLVELKPTLWQRLNALDAKVREWSKDMPWHGLYTQLTGRDE